MPFILPRHQSQVSPLPVTFEPLASYSHYLLPVAVCTITCRTNCQSRVMSLLSLLQLGPLTLPEQ